jgi:hypothetical protein
MLRQTMLAALALGCAVPAEAAELPTRKAGLWELKMASDNRNMPAQTMQHCTDASTDKLMTTNFGGAAKDACSKQDIQNSGGTITVDSVCKFGPLSTASHAVITGNFDQAYKVNVTTKREGLPTQAAGATETHMTIDAKWLGPCKPDQKAGDVIMSNGMKMNIRDMQSLPGRPSGTR